MRSRGSSYICDINGFSFVKGNKKYYEDFGILIRDLLIDNLRPDYEPFITISRNITSTELPLMSEDADKKRDSTMPNFKGEELRSIVAVFRHADRSPKQKMKVKTNDSRFIQLYMKSKKGDEFNEVKLKKPNRLQELKLITEEILDENNILETNILEKDIYFTKLMQLHMVLSAGEGFDGITRKVQLKPLDFSEDKTEVTRLNLIMKWGGDLTHSGLLQARELGKKFRMNVYPRNSKGSLLRLHNTCRHDLKCYSSEEGRCLKTAAAFLQGLLELEGSLIPIIFSMVRTDKEVLKLIDVSSDVSAEIREKVKNDIDFIINKDCDIQESLNSIYSEVDYLRTPIVKNDAEKEIIKKMHEIKNPLQVLKSVTG